jgi:hypothetical protein
VIIVGTVAGCTSKPTKPVQSDRAQLRFETVWDAHVDLVSVRPIPLPESCDVAWDPRPNERQSLLTLHAIAAELVPIAAMEPAPWRVDESDLQGVRHLGWTANVFLAEANECIHGEDADCALGRIDSALNIIAHLQQLQGIEYSSTSLAASVLKDAIIAVGALAANLPLSESQLLLARAMLNKVSVEELLQAHADAHEAEVRSETDRLRSVCIGPKAGQVFLDRWKGGWDRLNNPAIEKVIAAMNEDQFRAQIDLYEAQGLDTVCAIRAMDRAAFVDIDQRREAGDYGLLHQLGLYHALGDFYCRRYELMVRCKGEAEHALDAQQHSLSARH